MEIKRPKKKIFIAYSRKDAGLLEVLKTHLKTLERNNLVEIWSDSEIEIGMEWEREIKNALLDADIILLLISADFIASDYCYEREMRLALKQHEEKQSLIIPLILRECLWELTPFAKFQALPQNGIPITDRKWDSVDQPLNRIVRQLHELLRTLDSEDQAPEDLIKKQNASSAKTPSSKEEEEEEFNPEPNYSDSHDIEMPVSLTLLEIKEGIQKSVRYTRRILCSNPVHRKQTRPQSCSDCSTAGFIDQERSVEVVFSKGIEEGMILRLSDQGHQVPGLQSEKRGSIDFDKEEKFGDLLLRIKEKPHKQFSREGDDLSIIHPLNVFDAALGTQTIVPLLDHKKAKINIPPGTQDGKIFRLKGKGLPNFNTQHLGDLYVIIKIHVPTNLSQKENELLNKIRNSELFKQ